MLYRSYTGDSRSSKYLLWIQFYKSIFYRFICNKIFSFIYLHNLDMNVIVNRELKNRLRTINSIEDNRATVQNDFRLLLRMSKQLIIYMA